MIAAKNVLYEDNIILIYNCCCNSIHGCNVIRSNKIIILEIYQLPFFLYYMIFDVLRCEKTMREKNG